MLKSTKIFYNIQYETISIEYFESFYPMRKQHIIAMISWLLFQCYAGILASLKNNDILH